MISYSVTIDVPNLEAGLHFYQQAFGFTERARPIPNLIVLQAGERTLCLFEKPTGSHPIPNASIERNYNPHWTPVHLDFHVADFESVLAQALVAGATCEQRHDPPQHGSVAFCRDPFGHGFCIIQNQMSPKQ